ncbi:SseB family protein [Streptomyces sp. TP-A0356]|uniref:SseB family protein n=1 Tax=Streptomyces sp. TP-A0356 TaxID=1359208 RepID=UPI0006E206AF|nr:SseB family protein [Streptomyces sp. TP-A0356]
MSTSNPNENAPSPEAAASEEAQAAADTQAALMELANSEVLVPQGPPPEGEERPEGAVALPVIEQDGKRFVPVFTSEEALVAAGADPGSAVSVPLVGLAANWPADDLWLAVDPSSEEGLALPADLVRALPALSQAGLSGQTGQEENPSGEAGQSPTA